MRKVIYVVMIMCIIVSFTAFSNADVNMEPERADYIEEIPVTDEELERPLSEEEQEEQALLSVDYMQLIIDAIVAGDLITAETYMENRNYKIDRLGLEAKKIDVHELNYTAKITHAEAGSSWLSDTHQQMVASVLWNRVNSPEFPDTVIDCVHQPGQYYGRNSRYFANLKPSERAVRNALYVIENGPICPASVVFQANFTQGSGTYLKIEDKYLATTYFCYSSKPSLYE